MWWIINDWTMVEWEAKTGCFGFSSTSCTIIQGRQYRMLDGMIHHSFLQNNVHRYKDYFEYFESLVRRKSFCGMIMPSLVLPKYDKLVEVIVACLIIPPLTSRGEFFKHLDYISKQYWTLLKDETILALYFNHYNANC